MVDRAVHNAQKRREELQNEIDRIDHFLEMYESLSGVKTPHDSAGPRISSRRRNNIKRLRVLCARLIEDAKRPLTRGEIADGLDRIGIKVHSQNPSTYIGTIMWRNKDEFKPTPEGYITQSMHQAAQEGE